MKSLEVIQKNLFDERYAWSEINVELASKETRVLDLMHEACLIESYFGVYVGKMLELFWYDLDATSMYTIEAFEAYTHYFVLRKYLEVVGSPISEEEIIALREKDKGEIYDDEIKELVNFMATEHFAAHFFEDLSKLTKEPVLQSMLSNLSREEVIHSQFAFDLLTKRLDKDPNLKDRVIVQAKEFQHVGAYVLPTVTNVEEDNLKIIQRFNEKVKQLTGESISDYISKQS